MGYPTWVLPVQVRLGTVKEPIVQLVELQAYIPSRNHARFF